ncbi:MAG: Holliday junction branch migration protein RuvA [Atopobiaceae bacterium]|nr:Holliday junction branch migration protein RuvA [Atopobiaceae bacterium]
MIVQLTGTLVEVMPTYAVLDVQGVGYELGISHNTAASLPQVGSAGVTILTRLVVSENAMSLYGFSSREERTLFDRLVAISGIGPKLALSVLSTFTPSALATIVATQDVTRMAQVPGVGRRKAQRLLVDLDGVFQKDAELRSLVGLSLPADAEVVAMPSADSPQAEAMAALLSMGFTPQEAELALDGCEDAGATTVEKALSYALRRLGGGR